MKITYLDNSGFSIEMGKLLLIFDYYNTTPAGAPGLQGGTITRELVESFERVYFFASHNHYDHFSSQIYSLAAPHVRYILDVGILNHPEELNITRISQSRPYEDDWLRARACPSTDIGCSLKVEVQGKTIFHAGDLNCWHWAMDCSMEEELQNRNNFDVALDSIATHMDRPDVAFFPVDPRLKGPFDDGALLFIHRFRPRLFVPMHFVGDFSIPARFKSKVGQFQPVFAPSRRGDSFVLEG